MGAGHYRVDDFSRVTEWTGNSLDTTRISLLMYVDILWHFQSLAIYWLVAKSLCSAIELW